MSTEANKAVARRWYTLLSTKNLDEINTLFHTAYVDHNRQVPPGVDGLKQFFEGYFAAFPDLEVTVDDMIAEDDKVVARFTARGTHQGPLMGLPASGKHVQVTAIDILRFVNDKIVEHWGEVDLLGMLQQIGAVQAPSQSNGAS